MPKELFLTAKDRQDIQKGRFSGKSVLVILVNPQGEILLSLREKKSTITYPDFWTIPGGSMEENETPTEAVIREVREETGFCIQGPIHEFIQTIDRNGKNHLEQIFVASIDKNIQELHCHEGDDMRFFSKNQIAKPKIVPFIKSSVLRYFQAKKEP